MDYHSLAHGGAAIVTIAVICLVSPLSATPYSYIMDFNLPIPSPADSHSKFQKGWMDDAIIEIEDHYIIEDIDVSVTFTHEALIDLQISLISPAGTNVFLTYGGSTNFLVRDENGDLAPVGGSGTWFFDDEAEISIEEANEPFFGLFRPVESLSLLNQEDVHGLWRLKIYDALMAHAGYLDNFTLYITSPEPATGVLMILGAGLLTIFKSHRRR
jgi:hypothetical protein